MPDMLPWPTIRLGDLCTVVRGGSPRPAGDPRFFGGSFIPWLTVAAITNLRNSEAIITETAGFLTEAGSLRSRRFSPGTVVIANSGWKCGVAKILGFECCGNDGVAGLQNLNGADPYFISYWINSQTEELRARSAAGNEQPNLNTDRISGLIVPFPSMMEQKAIAEALSDADALIEGLERLIAKKRLIKQGAMQDLLTAKRRLPGFSGEWVEQKLGEVARISTGGRNNQDKDPMGEYPFFVRSDQIERIRTWSHDCEAILVPGEGRIGKIFHYVNGKFDVHQRVYCIHDFSKDVLGIFVHTIMRQFFGKHAMTNTVKATVDSLRRPTFTQFFFRRPPTINEQQAISEVLTDMNAEIQALETRLDKARQVKEGMMQNLLTGRIRLV